MLPSLKQLVEILTYIMLLLFNMFGVPTYPTAPVTIPNNYQPEAVAPSTEKAARSLRIVQPDDTATERSSRTMPGGAGSSLSSGAQGLNYSGDLAIGDDLAGGSRRRSNAGAGSGTEWDEEFVPAGNGAPSLTPLAVTLGILALGTGAWLGRRYAARRRERDAGRAFRS